MRAKLEEGTRKLSQTDKLVMFGLYDKTLEGTMQELQKMVGIKKKRATRGQSMAEGSSAQSKKEKRGQGAKILRLKTVEVEQI